MLEIKIFFIDHTAISFRAIIEIFGIQLCFVSRILSVQVMSVKQLKSLQVNIDVSLSFLKRQASQQCLSSHEVQSVQLRGRYPTKKQMNPLFCLFEGLIKSDSPMEFG